MDETTRSVRQDEDRGPWGWISPGLAVLVFTGIVAAAGAAAFQIGKQQTAADDRKRNEAAGRAIAQQQQMQLRIEQTLAERDRLRDRVLQLETELLAERSAQPQEKSSLRCINGELVVRKGNTWSSAGDC
jgi:cytochrome c-type biogenesis protein CcmH/NrfG